MGLTGHILPPHHGARWAHTLKKTVFYFPKTIKKYFLKSNVELKIDVKTLPDRKDSINFSRSLFAVMPSSFFQKKSARFSPDASFQLAKADYLPHFALMSSTSFMKRRPYST